MLKPLDIDDLNSSRKIYLKKMRGVTMTIEEVLAFEEMQIFDRNSVNIEPKRWQCQL